LNKKVGIIQRLFFALPDTITSALMLTAWIAPTVFGPTWVRNLVLTVVVECFVVLLSVLYGIQKANPDSSRSKRLLPFITFAAVFSLFIAAFSVLFHNIWPLIAFGLLCAARFASLWSHPDLTNQEDRMLSVWLMSPVFYFIGIFLVVFVQPPPLGLTPAFITSMDLLDSGDWMSKPYYQLAFGFFYFGAGLFSNFLSRAKTPGPTTKCIVARIWTRRPVRFAKVRKAILCSDGSDGKYVDIILSFANAQFSQPAFDLLCVAQNPNFSIHLLQSRHLEDHSVFSQRYPLDSKNAAHFRNRWIAVNASACA
jgi:hypothetical protein